TRVVPSHAVEMTAALLDRSVAQTLERQRVGAATLEQKQDLATIIHLCGAGPGASYARRGFRLHPGQHCGDHDVARYLADVNALKRKFTRLASARGSSRRSAAPRGTKVLWAPRGGSLSIARTRYST